MMKKQILSILSLAILVGCQSTTTALSTASVVKEDSMNPLYKGSQSSVTALSTASVVKEDPINPLYKGSYSSHDASYMEKYTLGSYNSMSSLVPYMDICQKNFISDGKFYYFNEKYNRSGDSASCYQILAEKTAKLNGTTVEQQRVMLIYQDMRGGEVFAGMAANPKYAQDKDLYEKQSEQWEANKYLFKEIENSHYINSASWSFKEINDDFEQYSSLMVTPVITKYAQAEKDYTMGIECRVTEDSKKLMFTWRVEGAIATPSSTLELKAILGGKPQTYQTTTYSNSYRSGYTQGKGAWMISKFLSEGGELKIRIEGRTEYVDYEYPKFIDNTELNKVMEACK